ncbi:MAG: alpha-amylase family glycosyl hydrolase [Chloroflexota bacterium]
MGRDMPSWRNMPVIYEINTWVWLEELSRQAGRRVTLANVPPTELAQLADDGFDAVWLMGVWQRSPAGRRVAQEHRGLQAEYHRALPDFTPPDVVGSPYAIHAYHVDPALGGDAELAALRQRLRKLNLRLILDFVPNHLALDHLWVTQQPHLFVPGSPDDVARAPENYFRAAEHILAHGRDPYFPGWTDTVQLDYRRPETRQAMIETLLSITARCDGLRCDMAMLVTGEVFRRTWGGAFEPPDAEFWPDAIAQIKASRPDFLLLAEVYWDIEYTLLQQGFDYCYDKRLYDRLRAGDMAALRDHVRLASTDYQRRLVHFIENHDEPRALAVFGPGRNQAAAVAALTLPGARLIHQGQTAGYRLKLPVQLGRYHPEAPEPGLEDFYRRLLAALHQPVFHEGQWRWLEPQKAWPGNPSHQTFFASGWQRDQARWLAVINLAAHPSQCYLPLPWPELAGSQWDLYDRLSDIVYCRQGDDLLTPGLYLDVPGLGYHLFVLEKRKAEP